MLKTFTEFIKLLESNQGKDVVFLDALGQVIPRVYHLTEIKNCQIESVDCGGMANRWTEVLLQLWVPRDKNPENHPLTTEKVLKIIYQVQKLQSVDGDGDLFFEYNAPCDPIAKYQGIVGMIDETRIEIKLGKEQACCKAIERGGCC